VRSIKSGLNVEMPDKRYFGKALLDSVNAGLVSEELINQRVREILRVRLAIKPVPESEANKEITSQPAQQKIAYSVASKSIVLLKNDGILPLQLGNKPVIAVIGANATQKMATGGLGAGVKTLYEITPLDGLKDRVGDKATIIFAQGYEPVQYSFGGRRKKTPEEIEEAARQKELTTQKLTREALDAASKANLVIFVGGDNRAVETEGSDRQDIFLPSGQDKLVEAIAGINKNIITILTSGAPNDLNTVEPVSKALIISWFNGSEGGNALADVLMGNISPGGRLPFTLPVKLEDSPAYSLHTYPQGSKNSDVFANLVSKADAAGKVEQQGDKPQKSDPNSAYYSEESLVGYRWYDTKNIPVKYPFGYGLTYTTFEYSNLKTNKEKYGKNDVIAVSIDLKNTGRMIADEVVQIYVHRIDPKVDWPQKELKAFSRNTLNPAESKTIQLLIPVRDLMYWNEKMHSWDNDFCQLEIMAGASSQDIKLKKEVVLK
jgi:beta-glucosidase